MSRRRFSILSIRIMLMMSILSDPFVGRFVRGIHLRLVYIKDDGHGFISSAHQRSFITTLQEYIPGILTEYPSEAIPAAFTTLRSALTGLANRTMSARNFDNLIGWGAPKPKGFNGPSTPGSFDRFVMALRDAFPGFVNLEVFCIDSWDVLDTYDLQPFWNAMWLSQLTPETRHLGLIPSPPTSSTLRRLSLGGSLYGYETFARSDIPHLVNLKELALEFTGSAVARIEKTDETQRILLDVVVPFIRKQAPQLEFLKIWSWALIELEDMFLKLNKLADDAKDCNASIFPRMHTFSVRMPFNKAFPQNASGLKDLLHRASPTIQHLELRLNPTGVAVDPTPDVLLGRWLHDIMISDRRPTELKTLQIYPTITPLGFEAVLKGIQASSATLKMVGIRDSYLQFDQVKQVIDALDPNTPILGLRLNVWRLTAALMDLFAGRLPNLQCISLYIGDTPIDDPNASLVCTRLFRVSSQPHHKCASRKLSEMRWPIDPIQIGSSMILVFGKVVLFLMKIPCLRFPNVYPVLQVFGERVRWTRTVNVSPETPVKA